MVAGVREFVEVDGGAVEIEIHRGDATSAPLVFLHEGLGSIDLWRGFPDDVGARVGDRTVLVYARHGYGQSAGVSLPRPVTYMHHEADVVLPELLAALDLVDPVLIGHSDGASIALLYAGAGHRVAGLVCLAPHVYVEPESITGIERARDVFAETDMRMRMERYQRDPAATFRGWNDVWLSPGFRDWDITDRLGAIDAPLLLIQGFDDEYGTFAQLDTIERLVNGNVEQLRVDGAGHAPHLDARDAVVDAVANWLRVNLG